MTPGCYLTSYLVEGVRRKVVTCDSFAEVLGKCPYRSVRSRWFWCRLAATMWSLHHDVPPHLLANSAGYRRAHRAYQEYLKCRESATSKRNQ